MSVIGIICIGPHNQINHNGELLYRFKSDMENFRNITINTTNVILGRKTFDEEYFPLENRFHLVLTRDTTRCSRILPEVAYYTYSTIKDILEQNKDSSFCVIGGLETYKALIDYIDIWYITKVYEDPNEPDISKEDKTIDIQRLIEDKGFAMIDLHDYQEVNQFTGKECKYYIQKYININLFKLSM